MHLLKNGVTTTLDRTALLEAFRQLLLSVENPLDRTLERETAWSDFEDMRCYLVGWTDQSVLEEFCRLVAKHVESFERKTHKEYAIQR